MELLCKSCLAKLFIELLHGTVVQKLPHEAIFLAFVWNCHAKASFQNYFSSFYVKLSCKSCLSKLFCELSFGTVEQKLTCKAISQGEMSISISRMLRCALKQWPRSWAQSELCWAQSNQSVRDAASSSRAQVALRSFCISFCMELSCQSCLAELFLKRSHGTVVQNLLCEAIF